MKPIELYQAASKLSADEWYQVLVDSVDTPEWGGFTLPGFPPDAMQSLFVGSSNKHALTEALTFYRAIQTSLHKYSSPLSSGDKVMDFGCGWGRYLRFFYRNAPWDNLYGIDPWYQAIEICKETGVHGQLIKSDLMPPLPVRDGMFKLIFAYSVFSHLSPMAADAWIAEFARVVCPGGLVVITTQGKSFIDFCASLRGAPPESDWHHVLQNSFVDVEGSKKKYDAGEFLYEPNSGGPELDGSIYGDAIVPKGYVQRAWAKHFDLVDFVDDRSYLPQALIVLKAKSK